MSPVLRNVTVTLNVAGGRYCPACEHVTLEAVKRAALDQHPCGHCAAEQTVTLSPETLHAFAAEITAHEAAQEEIETLRARIADLESVNAALKASRAELQTAITTVARSLQNDLTKERMARQRTLATFAPTAPGFLYPTH